MESEIQALAAKAGREDPRQRGQEKDLVNRQLMRNAVAVLEKVQLAQGSKSLLQLGLPPMLTGYRL